MGLGKILLAGALVAAPVVAMAQQGFVYVSSEGHQYRHSLNQNGAVLVSLFPVARFTGTGAMTQIVTGIETIFLGRNCDTYSEVFGTGTWGWANGGFAVEFAAKKFGFPRQEIDANNGLNCEF